MSIPVTCILKRTAIVVAALSMAASGLLRTGTVGAAAVVTPISVSNIPLTVAIPSHPQVIIALTNSQSMDGDMDTSLPGGGGAIMTGSGALNVSGASYLNNNSISPVSYTIPSNFTPPVDPGSLGMAPYTVKSGGVQYDNSPSRLNVAKAGISAILNDFMEYADFALIDYASSYNNCCGTNPYTTWVYYMSNTGGFTFTNTVPSSGEYVTNPCWGVPLNSSTTVNANCAAMDTYLGSIGINNFQYMPIAASSDDPDINDVLYDTGPQAAWINYNFPTPGPTPANPYPPHYSLSNYENGGITETYNRATPGGPAIQESPTNAGYVPYSTQVMQVERGFGFLGTQVADPTSGGTVNPPPLIPMQSSGEVPTAASVAAAVANFTPYLQPETNSTATTEIKAMTVQSPVAGLLSAAKSYYSTDIPSTNGCRPLRYVILVTDGLPTEDLSGHMWPPLGSVSASPDGYNVYASFDDAGTGALLTTNDQALTDTINVIAGLYGETHPIRTYVIGLGAGVSEASNPTAYKTLKAMAVAGGTGNFFPANSPAALANDMQVILAQILAATQSTSSATVNTTGLNTSSMAYKPSFDTSDLDQDWTGDLLAYPINASTGVVETSMLQWSAQAQLDAQAAGTGYETPSRIIATWDPVANAGTPFEWTTGTPTSGIATSTTLGQELETNTSDMSGQDALNYLRGDRALEIDNGGPYRSRTHILGDIVDSAPLYIGAVVGPYQSSTYYSFAQSNINRKPVLYLGADDGMLHAFDAATGNELFAFIPNGVFSNLINLTNPYYNERHQFFVDGSPQASDVQFTDGVWHTELVGGERAGGNSIYALDVTDPASITTEADLASKVLWEFTDPDMGLTYSTPAIAQTAAGASGSNLGFTVFFGNGYNSPSQRPFLYALDPQSGAVRAKIDLCAQVPTACDTTKPNGLSSVVAVNSIGGVGAAATTLYAGDLEGNVWRVDITSETPASWVVSLLFQATDASGARQPITTVPVVSLNPDFPRLPGVMVYVGTGQMLGIPDLSSTQVQTMYGIYDSGNNPSPLTRDDLQPQALSALTGSLRIVTGGPIVLPSQNGWRVDLSLLSGERIVTDPRIDGGAVVVTTVQPSSNTCDGGDVAWLMEFNYAGGTFITPQFDTNDDGSINSSDQIANGLLLGSVYAAAPVIVKTPCTTNCQQVKLITESSGAIQNVTERGAQQQRTSWWEIR